MALVSEASSGLVFSDLRALLTAVGERDAWRECLLTYHVSCGLTQCLLSAADLKRHAKLSQFTELVTPNMLKVLNGWLQPDSPWSDIPDDAAITTTLLGSGWRSLCCQDLCVGDLATACSSVHGQEPPFMSGMAPWERQAVVMALPEIDAW